MCIRDSGWTPFAGMPVYGQVRRVVLRGAPVYADGELLATPGCGQVLFDAAR